MFHNLPAGEVTVVETEEPNGWKFGTLLLTPKAIQAEGSDDAKTGADYDAESATVTLDLSGDPDNDAMLHIYNFEDSPPTDTAPAATSTATGPTPLLPLAAGALGLLGGAWAMRRRLA
jgi:hypothetical protein